MAASDNTIYRLGAPRKLSGECNTFDKIWVIKVNQTEHKASIGMGSVLHSWFKAAVQ